MQHTSPLPQVTTRTHGAQSHGLNKLNGHFADVVLRLRECYLCIVSNDGKGIVVNEVISSSMGHEHDVNAKE